MNFSFACPHPCNHEIKVDAQNYDSAVVKLIDAGAMCCRNLGKNMHCEKTHLILPPLAANELKNIIRLSLAEKAA
jgi:hypothetical protein